MAARRTDMHRLQELIRLHRQGLKGRAIGRALQMGRDTVRVYVQAFARAGVLQGGVDLLPDVAILEAALHAELPARPLPTRSSSIESFRPQVEELTLRGAGPKAIFDRLRRLDPDFPGSLSAIKRMCRRLQRERGVRPQDVVIRVETPPGEFAYVDFGYAGLRYDKERGILRKSWVFVMVLGYSRHMVAWLVFDQKVSTWLWLHVRAFEALGGVPRVIVPDNLKAAVVRAAFGIDDEPLIHRSYRELARHSGFRIEPTRPRTPEHKGKVESGVKYVRRCFLATLDSVDLAQDDAALQVWLREIAGKRVHGTIARVPAAVFAEEERPTLLPLPQARYELVLWKRAKLHRDSHVRSTAPSTRRPGRIFTRSCGRARARARSSSSTRIGAWPGIAAWAADSARPCRSICPTTASICASAAAPSGRCGRSRSDPRRFSWSRRSSIPTTS